MNAQPADAGFYSCAAVSPSGSVLSRAQLRVGDEGKGSGGGRPEGPPVIQLGPANQTLPEGSSEARFPCESLGGGHKVTWLKDGVPVHTLLGEVSRRIHVNHEHTLIIKGKENRQPFFHY